jgi:hypothetical protein
MFIRFTVPFPDDDSGCALGIFQAVFRASEEGRLHSLQAAWLREEMDWFNQNLRAPRELSTRAVFWFRAHAGEPVTRIWSFVHVLERVGVPVHVYRTRRPGTIVYQDDYQIAAIPWRDTFDNKAPSRA